MDEPLSPNQNVRDDTWASERVPDPVSLLQRILQAERAQVADESRINFAITAAEKDITWLRQRPLDPEQLQSAIAAIRDRTVLAVRDVRKNMQQRSLLAERMQECLSDDFKRTRFSRDCLEDEKVRRKFLQTLERTATSDLIEHFCDAMEAGNFACAELIRSDFRCRDDRHALKTRFELTLERLSRGDPVAMRKRLANICKAAERVDARVAGLLRVVYPPRPSLNAVA